MRTKIKKGAKEKSFSSPFSTVRYFNIYKCSFAYRSMCLQKSSGDFQKDKKQNTYYLRLLVMLCFYLLGKKHKKGKLHAKAATAYRQNLGGIC